GPIYLIGNNQPIRSSEDATYFIQWIDKVYESAEKQPYLTNSEKDMTLNNIAEAKKVFELRK
ncbi:MAG: hypothetical protein RLN86_11305, partial [Cyclobacteriaceae bacterium]